METTSSDIVVLAKDADDKHTSRENTDVKPTVETMVPPVPLPRVPFEQLPPLTEPLSPDLVTLTFHSSDGGATGALSSDELYTALNSLQVDVSEDQVKAIVRAENGEPDDGTETAATINIDQFRRIVAGFREVAPPSFMHSVSQTKTAKLSKLLFTVAVAVYTLYSLTSSYQKSHEIFVHFSSSPPKEHCVPFFDHVRGFFDEHPGTSDLLFGYSDGVATVCVCSDLPESTVVEGIGSRYVETIFSYYGCDLRDPVKRAIVVANCIPSGTTKTCEKLISTPPLPHGVEWSHNFIYDANCTFTIVPIDGVSPCKRTYVGVFSDSKWKVATFFLWVLLISGIFALAQLVILLFFLCNRCSPSLWGAVSWIMQGPWGALLVMFLACCCGVNPAFLDDIPQPQAALGVAVLQDLLEGLAQPLVSYWGCSYSRFPLGIALMTVKVAKVAWLVARFCISGESRAAVSYLSEFRAKRIEIVKSQTSSAKSTTSGDVNNKDLLKATLEQPLLPLSDARSSAES